MGKTFLTLLALFAAAQTFCQPPKTGKGAFILGVTDTLHSAILSENRALNIYLPAGYSPDSAMLYPVIYLLDGSADEDFIHIAGLVQFLNFPWVHILKPSIVVGIANVDRKRDFTFPSHNAKDLALCPTSGGSAKFISFIADELQPYIRRQYKAGAQSTLIGESLGGLVATEILFQRPALFNHYVIISPSLWWNDESLLQAAPKNMPPGTAIFVAAGNEGKQMQQDVEKLVSELQHAAPDKKQVLYFPFPEETHATILHRSVYKAFEVLPAQ